MMSWFLSGNFWLMTVIIVGILLPMECNGLFNTVDLTEEGLDGAIMQYQINENDPNAPNGQDTVTIILEVPEVAWCGFAFSTNGGMMVGSETVVGIPSPRGEEGIVSKFDMTLRSFAGFVPLPKQTLINPTMTQTNTTTTLQFTKILIEENEIPILKDATNTFLTAWGTSNMFGYHAKRSAFTLFLAVGNAADDETTTSPGNNSTTSSPDNTTVTIAPTPMPTSAPTMLDVNGTTTPPTSPPTPPTRLRHLA